MVDASNFQKLELFRDPNNNDVFVARDPSDGSTFAVPFDSIEANSLSVNGTSFDDKADKSQLTTKADKSQLTTKADLTGTNGVLRSTQVPDLSITSIDTVANQSERLALDAEEGDVAIQTDVNKTFLLTTNDPTVDSNWSEVQLDVTGAISGQTITPSQTGTSTNRTDVVANSVDANTVTGDTNVANRQGCRVFLSSDQNTNGSTKIAFDSEVFDSGGNFDTSSHDWTCPQDGLYIANLQVQVIGGTSNDLRQLFIGNANTDSPNGEGAFLQKDIPQTGDTLRVQTVNQYNSGDTISAYYNNTSNTGTLDSGRTFFEVAFLGGL
ncbi:putative SGNH hydrolase [environmental Halophage eHP-16]|nr:putative SGNH hydrolase [environmental Halophage eHP-16]